VLLGLAQSSVEAQTFRLALVNRVAVEARLRDYSGTNSSLTQKSENDRILHTAKDKLSVMNLDDCYATYRLVATYLAYLDHFLGEPEIAGARTP
jgi:hypothetical protein